MDWASLKSTKEEDAGGDWDEAAPAEAESLTEDAIFADPQFEADASDTQQKYPFLGKRWREITDPAEARQAWMWLREWVDWFVAEFEVSVSTIPSCWYRHRPIVAELWAAANAEMKAWEEEAASTLPLTAWNNYLPGLFSRLRENGGAKRCSKDDHVASSWHKGLEVNEADWAAHLSSVNDVEVGPSPGRWRMAASTESGNQIVSDPVEVPSSDWLVEESVSEPVLGVAGDGQITVSATVTGDRLYRSWWERQEATGEWIMRTNSLRDISARTDDDEDADDQEGEE
ncbi:MAG: hypothetical protein L0G31_09230 [Kocuria sp.]|nr:hypothetical protein [Kocuria sp.]